MKHYTYDERYNLIRKKLEKYTSIVYDEGKDYEILTAGGPKLRYVVKMSNRNGRKRLYFDILAEKRPVGYGIERICSMFGSESSYYDIFNDVMYHVLGMDVSYTDGFFDEIKVMGDTVRFRKVVKVRG